MGKSQQLQLAWMNVIIFYFEITHNYWIKCDDNPSLKWLRNWRNIFFFFFCSQFFCMGIMRNKMFTLSKYNHSPFYFWKKCLWIGMIRHSMWFIKSSKCKTIDNNNASIQEFESCKSLERSNSCQWNICNGLHANSKKSRNYFESTMSPDTEHDACWQNWQMSNFW